eukprot:SAG22_NODE_10525_length_529_cov_1.920930_1_plen_42_part_01
MIFSRRLDRPPVTRMAALLILLFLSCARAAGPAASTGGAHVQ